MRTSLVPCALWRPAPGSPSSSTAPDVGRPCRITTRRARCAMEYPGRIIKVGERDATIVRALKPRLNQSLGVADDSPLRLDPTNGTFGPKMKRSVQLFQARNVDDTGLPLKQDGEVGSLTWAALYGSP